MIDLKNLTLKKMNELGKASFERNKNLGVITDEEFQQFALGYFSAFMDMAMQAILDDVQFCTRRHNYG